MAISKQLASQRQKRLPRIWLMSDERLGERLLPTVQALPCGSGVIFRHYGTDDARRRQLFRQLRRISRRRGLTLLLAAEEKTAIRWGADGFHLRSHRRRKSRRMLHSAAVHNPAEIAIAAHARSDMALLSPVFATRSHRDKRPLGAMRFMRLRELICGRAIALGGMTRSRFQMMRKVADGWAAIDGLAR